MWRKLKTPPKDLLKNLAFVFLNPYQANVVLIIEKSQLIYATNQLTGFYTSEHGPDLG